MAWAEKQRSGQYRAMYRDASGARRSAGTYRHKAEAIRKGATAEDKARRRTWNSPDAAKQHWGAWADEWWPTRDIAASTRMTDAGRRVKHLDPRWGKTPIGQITRQEIRKWMSDLRAAGMSAPTINRCIHLLSASLSAAVDAEVIDVNPAARLKAIEQNVNADIRRYLTEQEYVLLREQMPTERDVLILEILLRTGMRWGELAGLHAARVNLENQTIVIQETYDTRNSIMKAAPKNRHKRLVGIPDQLSERLAQLDHAGRTCGYEHDAGKCPGPLLITTSSGTVLHNQNWAQRVFKPAAESAGLGNVRIHDLRHTHASWLIQDGVNLADIGHALGHRSAQTTQRYARLEEKPNPVISRVMESKATA